MFDRACVLNLDRRPDRLRGFYARLPSPWPLPSLERVPAVDGRKAHVPTHWECGPGAYGCLLSHLALWRDAAVRRQSLAIFEDDAVFGEDFARGLGAFLLEVPDDWQMLYFGGQHILPPEALSAQTVRCLGVKKTHAYAVRGEVLAKLPGILEQKPLHIDVSLSLMHSHFRVYAPRTWLCGQAAGRSDILAGSRGEPERWFDQRDRRAA